MGARIFLGMILTAGLVFPLSGTVAWGQPGSTQNVFGSIVATEGEVRLNGNPVSVGQTVFQDDSIQTLTGKVEIESNGSRFFIGPYSEIALGPPLGAERSFIHCLKGTLRSVIHKLLGRSFEVKTKYVTAGIRGTDFILHAAPQAAVLFTEEGEVDFNAQGQEVHVNAMQMSQAGQDLSPLKPEQISAHPQLAVLLNEVEQFCDLRIPADISGKKELNDIIARWNLNFSGYLVDRTEYDKAQKLTFLAFLMAEKRELKAEARLFHGSVFMRFTGEAKAALDDFEDILRNYSDTPSHEQALYNKGLIYFDLKEWKTAKQSLEKYTQRYPTGRFKENAEALLKKINENL